MDAVARQLVEQYVPSWVRLGVFKRELEDGKPLAVLYLPWDPAPRNQNRRRGGHWSQHQRDSSDAQMPALWAYRAAGKPTYDFPVDVETLVFRSAEIDDDGAIAGCKPMRDALVRLGLLPDDAPSWWRNAGTWIHAHPNYRQAWTVLIVRKRKETP